MSKKGVSSEEKKTRVLQIFYEKKTFFQLKELENIASKEKGVIANSVKDVVQSLVDDGLIETDKIGTSIYFWAFPSQGLNIRKKKLKELLYSLELSCNQLKTTTESVSKIEVNKKDNNESKILIEKLFLLQQEQNELQCKLKQIENNDPETFKDLKKDINDMKIAANRWTDNVFQLKTWCRNRFMIESNIMDKEFGIPEGFDYIE